MPDLESGNMLAKNLALLAKADSGGDRARRARAGRSDLARRLGAIAHGLVRGRGSYAHAPQRCSLPAA